tara:strand:- start:191 stop:559 length:369 start_codon:yes stop_codon:yes gene_type:complete
MWPAEKAIRNISETGRRNRLYGGVALILAGLVASLLFLPDSNEISFMVVCGLLISGFLVLLESTTQVCVYHGFLGTHESSSGRKVHSDEGVAKACRTRSWGIILQSVVGGFLATLAISYFLS